MPANDDIPGVNGPDNLPTDDSSCASCMELEAKLDECEEILGVTAARADAAEKKVDELRAKRDAAECLWRLADEANAVLRGDVAAAEERAEKVRKNHNNLIDEYFIDRKSLVEKNDALRAELEECKRERGWFESALQNIASNLYIDYPRGENRAYRIRLLVERSFRILRCERDAALADNRALREMLLAMPEDNAPPGVEYTDYCTGADGTKKQPYPQRRYRQCSIGYHHECTDPGGERCGCPCHRLAALDAQPAAEPIEMCEWCDEPVENGKTHGEGACFDQPSRSLVSASPAEPPPCAKCEELRGSLNYLAGFACRDHKPPKTCFDFPEQGGCCNSCWVRDWAKERLAALADNHALRESLVAIVGPGWRDPCTRLVGAKYAKAYAILDALPPAEAQETCATCKHWTLGSMRCKEHTAIIYATYWCESYEPAGPQPCGGCEKLRAALEKTTKPLAAIVGDKEAETYGSSEDLDKDAAEALHFARVALEAQPTAEPQVCEGHEKLRKTLGEMAATESHAGAVCDHCHSRLGRAARLYGMIEAALDAPGEPRQ